MRSSTEDRDAERNYKASDDRLSEVKRRWVDLHLFSVFRSSKYQTLAS